MSPARWESATILDIDALLADPETHIIVCCGSGGVGKTTTAAALGVRAAEAGRATVVLTIDPARRLAQSLGLSELDNTPAPIPGIDLNAGGSLDAMMLDMKRTFDEVVVAHSDPVRAQAILDNPFYQALSSSFAGTQEYMAMEKLGQLHKESQSEGRWNLIIVDTPPSRSALDFLDAPMRLGAFLDGRLIRILAAPARVGGRAYMRLVSASLGVFSNVLNKIIGAQVLADLQTFVASADALFGGFRERAEQTYALLAARGTAFLVIAAPEPDALREASYFVERLESESMPLAGLVLNRVAPVRLPDLSPDQAAAGAERLRAQDPAEDSAAALTASLLELHADRMRQSERQHRLADRFVAANPRVPVTSVTALAQDVHDLEGLRRVGELMAQRRDESPGGRTAGTRADLA
ncbi:MAG TPA: ArsA family ATPase [Dermatophilaceae bacterium]|nr:ArsA family ATPase [Dermatophilaceae bacterium]